MLWQGGGLAKDDHGGGRFARERKDPAEVEVVGEDDFSGRTSELHDLVILGGHEAVIGGVAAVVPLFSQ